MVYREVTMIEVKEVVLQWLEGAPNKVVARQLGVDVKTVRRYVRAAAGVGLAPGADAAPPSEELLGAVAAALEAHSGRPRGDSWEICHTHRERISSLLSRGVKLSKARKLLAREGVLVPYATLHRFAVRELGFGRTAVSIPLADCAPGSELQLDTGWMTLLEPDSSGHRRRFRTWIFTSVHTRHRFVYPCFAETTPSAIEACEMGWAFFGGVFRVLIPDNTKAIIQTADPLAPVINRTFLEYAQARGFHIDAARARKPKDKARVERAVQSVRDDCFGGEKLLTLEDARARGRQWAMQEYGRARHSRTGRMPLEHFEAEEQAALLPAPTELYDVPVWCDPIVGRDGRVQVAKALYSVPHHLRLVGKTVRARADRNTVRLYVDTKLVKTHVRQAPGGHATDPNDYPQEKVAYAMRDSAFLQRAAAKHGDAIGGFAAALLAGPLPWTRMRRVYALLGLTKRYGDARVEQACTTALAEQMHDLRRLERMVKLAAPKPPPAELTAKVIPLARYLRSKSHYAIVLASREPIPTGETP